jgi:alpha-tubulin suppressor-like RCC1 family protein
LRSGSATAPSPSDGRFASIAGSKPVGHRRAMSSIVRLVLVVSIVGCISDKDVCAPWGLVEDRVMDRCVCPEGFVEADAGTCIGPDGGVIRFDAGLAAGPDGGVDAPTSCIVGEDGCECEEDASRPCEGASEVGACDPGSQRCVEGRWAACEGRVGPTPETCNGADDDCNGTPDDGSARTSCGTAPRALATGCSGGSCFVDICADGFLDCDSDFENGCESELGTPATCSSCGDVCGWACGTGTCNDAASVTTGYRFSAVLREDGTVAAWGSNAFGQLGDGTRGEQLVPVGAALEDVEALEAGSQHACAIIAGEAWCWGDNGTAAIGDGTLETRTAPTRVLSNVQSISAGNGSTCAVQLGQAWCWGAITRVRDQVRYGSAGSSRSVAVGADHACALASSGRVSCWGDNTYGQLGDGTYNSSYTRPVAALEVTNAIQVVTGSFSTCALRTDGTVLCWGILGSGSPFTSPRAVEIALDDVAQIDAGGEYSMCAVRRDSSLWCWGLHVGDGSSERRLTPVRVLEGVESVAVSVDHTCAVLTTGGVRCWGNNDAGQLGMGSRDPSLVPISVLPPR